MTVVAVIVARVVMPGMIVPGVRVESGRRGRRSWLRVAVRRIDMSVRVSRVIVAEGDAFEITRRPTDSIGMSKRNIVRWLAFEDEVCGLFGRK